MDESDVGGTMATVADASWGASTTASRSAQFYVYESYDKPKHGWRLLSVKRPTGMSSRQIETLGEALSKGLGYEPGTDIRSLVGRMRGSLMVASLENLSDHSGDRLLVREGSPEFKVIVPAASSSRRDQLSVAKALGHYFLHYRYFQFERHPKQLISKALAEQEALTFALAFLMPKEEFQRALNVANGRTDAVAASFGVPVEAAERRREFLPRT